MLPDPAAISHALSRSLIEAPPLVGDLPEAVRFPLERLQVPTDLPTLNLQQKLGHLSEDALAVALSASPHFDLLAHNLQIQSDAHHTLGELDFLLRDLGSGQLIHLELATKFYLAVPTESSLALPGPDARDNYFKKLDRLRTHQLHLPTLHRQHLPAPYRDEAIVSQQLLHGCLFDPIDATEPATADFIAPDCRRGRWLSIDQVPQHFPTGTPFQIIPKALWPVPLALLDDIPLEPWAPTPTLDRCLMLRIDDSPSPHFVTPSNYPGYVSSLTQQQ